jgi:Fe2+ or Zn2+ uptake regulation protein
MGLVVGRAGARALDTRVRPKTYFGTIMKSEMLRIEPTPDPPSGAERLRARGVKVTGPRLAILGLLERNRTHPSAEAVFAALRPEHPSLSLSTVYKTLDVFIRAGLCRHVTGEGVPLRVDGTLFPHDHASCRTCGAIFDVAAGVVEHPTPPARLPGGLTVTGLRVEYDVVCAACAPAAGRQGHGERFDRPGAAAKAAS